MKKILLGFGLLVVVAIGGLGWWLRATVNKISLENRIGEVQVNKVSPGWEIKTGDGSVDVRLPDGSQISVDKNSEIKINFDKDTTRIDQAVGKTWHRLKNLAGVATYEVVTPTTVAVVRGTKFGVENMDSALSLIYVAEDTVTVGGTRVETRLMAKAANTGIEVTDINSAVMESDWFKKNSIKDETFDAEPETLRPWLVVLARNPGRYIDIAIKLGLKGNFWGWVEAMRGKYDVTIAGANVCRYVEMTEYAKDKGDILAIVDVSSYLTSLEQACADKLLNQMEEMSLTKLIEEI